MEKTLTFFFFHMENMFCIFSSKSVISPFSGIMNILQINMTSKTYLELNRKKLTPPPAPRVSCQTNSPSCNIYDRLFLLYLSWNISSVILHPPSVCGIRVPGYIDGSNEPLHFARWT